MTAPPVLALEKASRVLAGRRVVRDLDLLLRKGEVLGLLGVNGAGKSTTLRMIAGVLAPSAGVVRVEGQDLQEHPELARRSIGYLPETAPLHSELNVAEFLSFCARLHGLARGSDSAVARAIERCGLGDVRRRLIGALSKGFRQRVGLAQAILHEPDLIVLDEPASGLDPVQALRLRELVRGLGADHAVVLSTHVLPDVLACCDRVAILHEGELRHEGRLGAAEPDGSVRIRTAKPVSVSDWRALPMVAAAIPLANDAHGWRVRMREGASPGDLAKAIVERGFGLEELRAESPALEEIFMTIAVGGTQAVAA
ncbi:MAG TPA: ABC transporter ATP-binding protein [Rhodanobacteraceae bacterium]|jgi:ABC-2 type transport system ATP-binding protein|nr:ABC transporter ATP-binding protein [Rhodanobacteraceae bacterium]